jgi:hypothetical protein
MLLLLLLALVWPCTTSMLLPSLLLLTLPLMGIVCRCPHRLKLLLCSPCR